MTYTVDPALSTGLASVSVTIELEYRADTAYHARVVLRATRPEGEAFDLYRADDDGRPDELPTVLIWPADPGLGAVVPRALFNALHDYPGGELPDEEEGE